MAAPEHDVRTELGPAPWEARARTWAALAFGLLAVLGAAYYFFVLQAQTRRDALEAFYAQKVARVARQAERKLQAYRTISSSALSFLHNAAKPIGLGALPSYREFVKECTESEPSAVRLCIARKVASNAAQASSGSELKLDACAPDRGAKQGSHDERPSLVTGNGDGLCATVPLAALFPERSAQQLERVVSREGLSALVVVDPSGRAVWQDTNSRLRLRSLPKLLDPNDHKAPKFVGSSVVSDLALGTGKYRAFVEPLELTLPGPEPGKLALYGILNESQLVAQSRRIDPISFLWAGLVLVLGALSFPLAKLWLLAPRSRFRTLDLRLLVLCAIAATLVTVSVFMGFVARYRLNAHLDARLKETATQVSARLEQKVKQADDALSALGKRFDFAEPSLEDLCKVCSSQPLSDASFDEGRRTRPVCECVAQHGQSGLFQSDRKHAGFQRAFWTNEDGDQQLKLAPGAHATPPLSLSGRSYFRRAMQRGAAHLFDQPNEKTLPRTVEIVRSLTSGATVLISARATSRREQNRNVVNGVLGVEASLDAFSAPLLPLGFQLAVLDEEGKVILHSNNDAHQGQSIFDESDGLDDLSALASPAGTTLSYMGNPSRAAGLLTKSGFLVLVIAPQALVDRPAQSMTLATLELCAMMLFGGLLIWLFLRFARLSVHANHGSHPRLSRLLALTTFRPFPALGASYAWLGLSLLIGASLTELVVLLIRPTPILCGMLTAFVTALCYGAARGRPSPMGLARSYATYCFGASAALLVMPAVLAFAGCYQHFVGSMAQREVAHIASVLEHRPNCFRGTCEDVFALSLDKSTQPSDGPATALARQVELGLSGDLAKALNSWIKAPVDGVLAQFSALTPPPSSSLSAGGFGVHREDHALLLHTRLAAGTLPHRIELPRLASLLQHASVTLLFMLCVLAALAFITFTVWTRSIGRLFFVDAIVWPCRLPESPKQISALLAAEAPRRVEDDGAEALLYLYPRAQVVTDLMTADGFAAWPRLPELEGGDDAPVYVLEELRDVFTDLSVVAAFEQAIARQLRIVIFSHLDPLEAPPGEARDRWLRLFARCPCVRGTDYQPLRANSPAAIALAWQTASSDEQRFLAQLSFDGHASPSRQNLPIVRALVARGLLDPGTFQLIHSELRDYVRSQSSSAELRYQEAKDGGTPWNMLKVPIATAVLVILAGVGQSQPDAMTLALPGFALSLPLMLRALISLASARLNGEKTA